MTSPLAPLDFIFGIITYVKVSGGYVFTLSAICASVCLSVSQQDISKLVDEFSVKFFGEVECVDWQQAIRF